MIRDDYWRAYQEKKYATVPPSRGGGLGCPKAGPVSHRRVPGEARSAGAAVQIH